jgi:hypothetical protein
MPRVPPVITATFPSSEKRDRVVDMMLMISGQRMEEQKREREREKKDEKEKGQAEVREKKSQSELFFNSARELCSC